jgi:Leucine rich repeat
MQEVLSLGNNDMNGTLPDLFQHMKNLIALDLHKNDFSGTLPGSIGELSKLGKELDSYGLCQSVPAVSPSPIPTGLPFFSEHLLLDNNAFTGTLSGDWFGMKNLMTLVLHHNKLRGEIPSSINGLLSLRDLWLNDNVS